MNITSHTSLRLTAAALAATALLVAADVSNAAKKRRGKIAKDLSVQVITPLGRQGATGAGDRLVLPFRLADRNRRRVNVEVEFGFDRNGDGQIADGTDPALPSEFERATQDRRDPRDTSRLRRTGRGVAVTYRPSRGGSAHSFVWNHEVDLGRARLLAGAQVVRDATGRAVDDPFQSGEPVFSEPLPGVVLRVRATRRNSRRQRTEWSVTESVSLDNSAIPSMQIDAVPVVDAENGRVEIDWTGFDDDSEDRNGNGLLDVIDLEDRDGDGVLDAATVAVAFDFHRLDDGAPAPTNPIVLERLRWTPCTRAVGEGDPDDGIDVAPPGVGTAATFVWSTVPDLGGPGFHEGRYLLRAIPYDDLGNRGEPTYWTESISIGDDQE